MNTNQMIEEAIKEFDSKFVETGNLDWWQTDLEYSYTATPSLVKDWLRTTLTKHEAAVLEREAKWCLDQKLPEIAEVPALYYPNNMKLVTVNKERNATLQSTADHLRGK